MKKGDTHYHTEIYLSRMKIEDLEIVEHFDGTITIKINQENWHTKAEAITLLQGVIKEIESMGDNL